MGSVGDFIDGGSSNQQQSQNSSSQTSNSQNQSSNNSAQAAASGSVSNQGAGSNQYNQGYAPIAAAMTPTLGYTAQAGNMMASLLGLPQSNFSYNQAPYHPPASLIPAGSTSPNITLPSLASLVGSLAPQTPSSTAAPVPSSTHTGTPSSSQPSSAPLNPSGGSPTLSSGNPRYTSLGHIEQRAMGGPVNAGQPYVVGENQPELFVPHTSGTIVPQVPGGGLGQLAGGMSPGGGGLRAPLPGGTFGRGGFGGAPTPTPNPIGTPTPTLTPSSVNTGGTNPAASAALGNFANSAGEQFVLDQGQKALSGASASNGVFDSGATGKELTQYGQNLGNTYLNDYMNHLSQYGQLGLGGASAMTGAGGVGQSQSTGGTTSLSTSAGTSNGSSSGSSTGIGNSTGISSGSGQAKNGLLPALGSIGF